MKGTQRVWILYAIVLSLYCLTAEEIATTVKRNAAGLIQFIYFKNALTSKFDLRTSYWGKGFLFLFPQKM